MGVNFDSSSIQVDRVSALKYGSDDLVPKLVSEPPSMAIGELTHIYSMAGFPVLLDIYAGADQVFFLAGAHNKLL